MSERRVRPALGQRRSAQRRVPTAPDEEPPAADIVELPRQYRRCGDRKIAQMLRTAAGWVVNDERVETLWRSEGLLIALAFPLTRGLARLSSRRLNFESSSDAAGQAPNIAAPVRQRPEFQWGSSSDVRPGKMATSANTPAMMNT